MSSEVQETTSRAMSEEPYFSTDEARFIVHGHKHHHDHGDDSYYSDDAQSYVREPNWKEQLLMLQSETLSETMSLASAIYRGYMENGRKYQTLREGEYWMPCDEKQFESMAAGHLQFSILDSHRDNSLFYSPLENPKHILDIGTGDATWAIEVADEFPDTTVHGVDLFPPPPELVPPNCILEVDDITKDWTWRIQFDMVHLRTMIAAFTDDEWDDLYAQIYDNLAPGGWIEQVEPCIAVECDDGTLPADSILHVWGKTMAKTNENAGRPADTYDTMKGRIEHAGFINVQQKDYMCPIGGWHPDPTLRDAGIIGKEVFKSGAEGWVMWLLTNYGLPAPWEADQVRLFVAKALMALNNEESHTYHRARRVWAQKPHGPKRAMSMATETDAGTEAETVDGHTEDDAAEGREKHVEGEDKKKKKKRKRTKKKKKAAVVEGQEETAAGEEQPIDTSIIV